MQKEEVTKKMKGILKKSIKNNEVSCTCDLWTDGVVHRHYLDLTAFWLSDEGVLQHTMLRCKVFPDERKMGKNIHREKKVGTLQSLLIVELTLYVLLILKRDFHVWLIV